MSAFCSVTTQLLFLCDPLFPMANQKKRRPPKLPAPLVRQKAHQIWQERKEKGQGGSAEGDWRQAAAYYQKRSWQVRAWRLKRLGSSGLKLIGRVIAAPFRLIGLLLNLLGDASGLLANKETRAYGLDIVKTVLTALAGIALILNFWDISEDRRLAQERLVTDRYIKAVELLGVGGKSSEAPKETAVRSGGIFSLERIAKDSPRDHWTIVEVLTTYVRKESPLVKQESRDYEKEFRQFVEQHGVSLDVQAALTVIGRRNVNHDCYASWWQHLWQSISMNTNCENRLVLAESNLIGSELNKANLEGANLGPGGKIHPGSRPGR